MKLFKRIFIILGSVLITIGLLGAAASFAIGGTLSAEQLEEMYSMSEKSFDNVYSGELKSLDISAVSAEVNVKYHYTDDIGVKYDCRTPGLRCEVKLDESGRLTVKEKSNFFMSFLWFGIGAQNSVITITLPDRYLDEKLDSVYLNMTSGSTRGDLPACEKLNITLTSGNAGSIATPLTISAQNAEMHMTSGSLALSSRADKMDSVKLTTTSGTAYLRGFASDYSYYNSTSGNITAYEVSGKVDVHKTSGSTTLYYSEWNDDLYINTTSGENTIYIPQGSGVNVNFNATSGNVEVDLNGSKSHITSKGTFTAGRTNIHGVTIEGTSGNSYISDVPYKN